MLALNISDTAMPISVPPSPATVPALRTAAASLSIVMPAQRTIRSKLRQTVDQTRCILRCLASHARQACKSGNHREVEAHQPTAVYLLHLRLHNNVRDATRLLVLRDFLARRLHGIRVLSAPLAIECAAACRAVATLVAGVAHEALVDGSIDGCDDSTPLACDERLSDLSGRLWSGCNQRNTARRG
eukprot:4164924-Prymnesium_polylepis.1